jgi:hypothetical protein
MPGGVSAGTGQGGNGGCISMFVLNTDTAKDPRFYLYTPVDASGTDGYAAGYGGGLFLELRTAAKPALPVEIPSVVIAGQHDFSGGKSAAGGGGGGGGGARVHALGSVHLRDSIDLNAGNAAGTGGQSGGQLDVISQLGSTTNDAKLSANGANAATAGGSAGYGGCISFEGRTVTSTQDLSAHGGDATGDASFGGGGGVISFMSHDAAADVMGKLDVAGGKGATPGTAGQAGNDIAHCVRRD